MLPPDALVPLWWHRICLIAFPMEQKTDEDKAKPKRKRRPFRRVLKILGIHYSQDKGHWILLTRRHRRIILGLILFVLVGFTSFFFYFSTRPEFCNSCHIMEPYVASWKTSSHKDVPCNDCHYAPGWREVLRAKVAAGSQVIKTLTGTEGVKLHAEVEDASCLRSGCHETRKLKGEVLFKKKYKFDHGPHLTGLRRGKKLRCTSCHSQIVQGSHITVTESVCFTCHFKGQVHDRVLDPIAGCTSCHDAPTEPVKTADGYTFKHKPYVERKVACWKCHFDSVQGTGDVPRQVCRTCHSEQEKLAKYDDHTFIHNWHVTKRKVECFRCHSEIRHGLHPEPYEQDPRCARCHSGGHGAHGDMFAGRGGRDVKGTPDKHSLANVDCVACHEIPSLSQHGRSLADTTTFKATSIACVECHGSKMKGTLSEWQSTLDEMLVDAKEELAKARKAFDQMPDDHPHKAKVKTLLESAQHNCTFVATASGAHNLNYAMDLLDAATDSAGDALRTAKKAIAEAKQGTSE